MNRLREMIENELEQGVPLEELMRAEFTPGMPEETLETAGCTGGCESYKDGLPDCERCSQFKEEIDGR